MNERAHEASNDALAARVRELTADLAEARRVAVLCADALEGADTFDSTDAMSLAITALAAVPKEWRTP